MKFVTTLLILLGAVALGEAAGCSGARQCQCLFNDGSHCCLYGYVRLSAPYISHLLPSSLPQTDDSGNRTPRPAIHPTAPPSAPVHLASCRAARTPLPSATLGASLPALVSLLLRGALLAITTMTVCSLFYITLPVKLPSQSLYDSHLLILFSSRVSLSLFLRDRRTWLGNGKTEFGTGYRRFTTHPLY